MCPYFHVNFIQFFFFLCNITLGHCTDHIQDIAGNGQMQKEKVLILEIRSFTEFAVYLLGKESGASSY